MNLLRIPLSLLLLLVATACVTINVYFPAEAAERAADRIIRDVYGEDTDTKAEPAGPQSWNHYPPAFASPGLALLDWLITPAHAEADISVNTPAIRKLEASMEARHRKLSPYYASGAVGMTGDGQISIHNQKQIRPVCRNCAGQRPSGVGVGYPPDLRASLGRQCTARLVVQGCGGQLEAEVTRFGPEHRKNARRKYSSAIANKAQTGKLSFQDRREINAAGLMPAMRCSGEVAL
jgi:hypothetical protein